MLAGADRQGDVVGRAPTAPRGLRRAAGAGAATAEAGRQRRRDRGAERRRGSGSLLLIILLASHRNDGDIVAARDADDRADRLRDAARRRRRPGTAAALLPSLAAAGRARCGAGSATRRRRWCRSCCVSIGWLAMASSICLLGLGIVAVGHLDLAGGDRALQLGIVVGERAQRQRQLAERLRDRDLLGDLRRRLERHVGDGLRPRSCRPRRLRVDALVGGEHAQVADDRLGRLERRAVAAAGHRLGQHQVDAVAREDEAGDAAGRGHARR